MTVSLPFPSCLLPRSGQLRGTAKPDGHFQRRVLFYSGGRGTAAAAAVFCALVRLLGCLGRSLFVFGPHVAYARYGRRLYAAPALFALRACVCVGGGGTETSGGRAPASCRFVSTSCFLPAHTCLRCAHPPTRRLTYAPLPPSAHISCPSCFCYLVRLPFSSTLMA